MATSGFPELMSSAPIHWFRGRLTQRWTFDGLAAIAFIPVAVEGFSDHAELDDKVAGEVLWLDLRALLAPQSEQGSFIIPHDDPGVGTPYK
jgi:hypothetical protein